MGPAKPIVWAGPEACSATEGAVDMKRHRYWKRFCRVGILIGLTAGLGHAVSAAEGPSIFVYKTPTCSYCNRWIAHLRAAGFEVETEEVTDLTGIRSRHGVTPKLSSCHTALVNDYVIEGHVPADVIQKLLKERPDVVGIAVPGMPPGSPGMEGPTAQHYDVLTLDRDGNTNVYASR